MRDKPIVVSHFVCNDCKNPITDYNGFHIQGNIMVADPVAGKGIIGEAQWLDKIDNGKPFTSADIPESVYCKNCFCQRLNIKQAPIIR